MLHEFHFKRPEVVIELFDQLGVEHSTDNINQFLTLMQAFKTYDERSKSYGQAWKQFGALSNLLSVARKAKRLMEVWWYSDTDTYVDGKPMLHKDNLDDAVDLLNYTAFFMRQVMEGNLQGDPPNLPIHTQRCFESAVRRGRMLCTCRGGRDD